MAHTPLRSLAGGVMVGSWLRYHTRSPSFFTMELTKSFPPADALIETLQRIDYQKLYHNSKSFVITVAAFVAAFATILWEKIQVLKFRTPDSISNYFYFSVNLIGQPGDEIVGLSVWNRYIGLYSDSINWGILDENGAL